ncbi:MAG: hypothetical protein CMH26_07575 [Micavibrio sp.]|nr:hypothetical protein [Micavibrio sp.]|tara:strand:- start:995 stop:1522 length:528 start_codon:yes stop_codon:yes gene_type:complete
MKNFITTLKALPKAAKSLKCVFEAARNGVNIVDSTNALETLSRKTQGFYESVRNENTKASKLFAQNAYWLKPDGSINMPNTWADFFNILQDSKIATTDQVIELHDPREEASIGRISYKLDILHNWYNMQDPRLSNLFESLAQLNNGVHNEVPSLFPAGTHTWDIKGKPYTLEVKR